MQAVQLGCYVPTVLIGLHRLFYRNSEIAHTAKCAPDKQDKLGFYVKECDNDGTGFGREKMAGSG